MALDGSARTVTVENVGELYLSTSIYHYYVGGESAVNTGGELNRIGIYYLHTRG